MAILALALTGATGCAAPLASGPAAVGSTVLVRNVGRTPIVVHGPRGTRTRVYPRQDACVALPVAGLDAGLTLRAFAGGRDVAHVPTRGGGTSWTVEVGRNARLEMDVGSLRPSEPCDVSVRG